MTAKHATTTSAVELLQIYLLRCNFAEFFYIHFKNISKLSMCKVVIGYRPCIHCKLPQFSSHSSRHSTYGWSTGEAVQIQLYCRRLQRLSERQLIRWYTECSCNVNVRSDVWCGAGSVRFQMLSVSCATYVRIQLLLCLWLCDWSLLDKVSMFAQAALMMCGMVCVFALHIRNQKIPCQRGYNLEGSMPAFCKR